VSPVPFVDTSRLQEIEPRPGWRGRAFDSPSLTFVHYAFSKDAWIHEHQHPQEEVWQVLEGELKVTIDGVSQVAGPGMAAIVPPNTPHAVTALTDGKAIVTDYPLRHRIGG
jgi:quercetin dioxygenase-like cupin family protein